MIILFKITILFEDASQLYIECEDAVTHESINPNEISYEQIQRNLNESLKFNDFFSFTLKTKI